RLSWNVIKAELKNQWNQIRAMKFQHPKDGQDVVVGRFSKLREEILAGSVLMCFSQPLSLSLCVCVCVCAFVSTAASSPCMTSRCSANRRACVHACREWRSGADWCQVLPHA